MLVTGCGGFVGGAIAHEAGDGWDVHALSRGAPLAERQGLTWHSLDLRETSRLRDVFDDVKPDCVIHAAAIADIDYCEANKDVATAVNVEVTEEVAKLCAGSGARMVYLSTDTVFDGEKGGYAEEDPPGPLNHYAETKARAERIVLAAVRSRVVVRVSLVMGLPMLGTGNSFLSRMMPKLEAGEEVGVPDEEIRSPIDIVTLARALLELAGNDYEGILHLAGNDVLNRHEMVRRIAWRLGYDGGLVVARNPSGIRGRAPRPLNASLCNAKARVVLKTPMRGLIEGLELVLAAKEGSAA